MKRALLALAALVGGALTLAGLGLAVFGLPLADIRPPEVSLDPDPASEIRGRALLAEMLEAHGGERALHRHRSLSFDFTDDWYGAAGLVNPWPANDQRAVITQQVHSFDSTAHLQNGPDQGLTWGITEGRAWVERDGARTEVDDPDIRFMLPTVHYFVEMPQRLTEADIVRYVGEREVAGQPYEVVYATWGEVGANAEYDQYLIYLHPETHRLAKVHYTVREILPVATGVAHLMDQREVDGFWFAHDMPVTGAVGDSPEQAFHRMRLANLRFD